MKLKNVVSRLKSKASVVKRINVGHEINSQNISKHYKSINKNILSSHRSLKTKTAIIVHLYYTDSWAIISKKLKTISAFSFDMFVSLPKQNINFKDTILETFPDAFIYESPNRGRDVLPFVSIAGVLYNMGYKHILKIHSKKSTHRTDGDDWMNKIVDALIPKETTLQKSIIEILEDSRTGVIGPTGQYVSLNVNFEANGVHMTNVVKKLYSKQQAYETLQLKRGEYGFFAGTMFWLNLDAIKPLIDQVNSVRRFESEYGQIDATFAHALERLFCIIPEIESRKIYQVDSNGVSQIKYDTGTIPDWSGVYIGPKPKN